MMSVSGEEKDPPSGGLTNNTPRSTEQSSINDVTKEDGSSLSQMSRIRDALFVMTICMAQLVSLGSLAQTLVPLPIIGHHFGVTTPGMLSWLTAAFSLTAGTFILPAGRLGDMFGLKKMYIVGFLFFALWTLICGFSYYGNLTLLAVCRGFQGVGSAMVVPNSMALIGMTYWHPSQEKKKHMCYALFGASAPVGFILGGLLATLCAQLSWWPIGFFISAGVLALNAIIAYFVIPSDRELQHHSSKQLSSDTITHDAPAKPTFDALGSLTGVTGLILFNFAWNQAAVATWTTPYVLALLILGVLSLVAFYLVETRHATQPLVPFRTMTFKPALALAVLSLGWGSFGIWIFYFFQTSQLLRGYLPLTSLAQNAAVAPSGLAAALLTGWLLSRVPTSSILLAATCCFLTGQALLATAPVEQTFWAQTFIALLVMPWGMDMSFPSGTALVSAGLPARYQGTASSLVDTVVNYSISLALGVAGTIDRNVGGVRDLAGVGPPGVHGQAGLYPGGDEAKNEQLRRGYRASLLFAVGLDALAVCIAAGFVVGDWVVRRKRRHESGQAA